MKLTGLKAALLAFASTCFATAGNAGTVTMWTFLNPANDSGREIALRNIIAEFETKNPAIKIVVEPQDWGTMSQKFVLSHTANRAPDVIWSAQDTGLLVNSGSLASLNPYLDGWDGPTGGDLLFASAYEKATYNGELMAVPIFPYAILMFYRKDVLAELGISEESLRTWDGLKNVTRKLQEAGKPGLLMPTSEDRSSSSVATTAFMELTGGHLVGADCRANFATPEGIKALELQVDMFREGLLAREEVSRNNDDDWDLFIGGRGTIVPQTSARAGALLSSAEWADEKTVGIMPWPSFTGEEPGPASGATWSASLWAGSQNKEEAAKFILHLVSVEAATEWTRHGQQLPLRRSVAENPEFSGGIYELNKTVASIMDSTAVFAPPGCAVSQSYSDWNAAVQEVFLGGIDPLAALKEAEAATNRRQ